MKHPNRILISAFSLVPILFSCGEEATVSCPEASYPPYSEAEVSHPISAPANWVFTSDEDVSSFYEIFQKRNEERYFLAPLLEKIPGEYHFHGGDYSMYASSWQDEVVYTFPELSFVSKEKNGDSPILSLTFLDVERRVKFDSAGGVSLLEEASREIEDASEGSSEEADSKAFYVVVDETKVASLSLDLPSNEDGHSLKEAAVSAFQKALSSLN